MTSKKTLSNVEQEILKEISQDPIKWAQAFIKIFNSTTKRIEPWIARWYQVEMLRDMSIKKVYRCGRRIGEKFCLYAVNCENILRVTRY